MKHIICILTLPMLLSCTKFTDTLGTVQDAAIQARMTFQPVVDGICADFAEDCVGNEDMLVTLAQNPDACEAYATCDEVRSHIITTFEQINMLIADANLSTALADSDGADEALGKALELIEQIRQQMRSLGYLE